MIELNDWLSMDKTGGRGNSSVTFTAKPYQIVDGERSVTLRVKTSTKSYPINVVQTFHEEPLIPEDIPDNQIWAKSTDGKEIMLIGNGGLDVNLTSSELRNDGWTVLTFDGDITYIPKNMYYNKGKIQEVVMPNSVVSINEAAFSSFTSLEYIKLSDNLAEIGRQAFYNCQTLVSVTIPNSVTVIREMAFGNCSSLVSVEMSDNIYEFEKNPFKSCPNLAEFKGSLVSNDGRCIVLNNKILSFAPYGLSSYDIPNNVTSIGDYAFNYSKSLASVTIPDSVTEICSGAFDGCSSLVSVTIPDSVVSINSSAFYGCTSLVSAYIGSGVTSINSYTFYGCSSLDTVELPSNLAEIGDDAFKGCSSLETITIPNSVTAIGKGVFTLCPNLAEFKGAHASDNGRILIIDNVLVGFAPYGLSSYIIPNGVTSIGNSVFFRCSLTSVTIPSTVTEVGNGAFEGCSSLETITCNSVIPPTVNSAFSSVKTNGKLYYPKGSDYSSWLSTEYGKLGYYGWTGVTY